MLKARLKELGLGTAVRAKAVSHPTWTRTSRRGCEGEYRSRSERARSGDYSTGSLSLGQSLLKVSTKQFGKWCPTSAAFTRGEYLRFVWSKLYERIQDKDESA